MSCDFSKFHDWFDESFKKIEPLKFKLVIGIIIFLIILIIGLFSLLINNTLITVPLKSDIITQSLTFIGTLLALLFTLITLPIQRILGKYSQDMVNRVLFDETFKHALYFFLGLFILDFFILFIFPTFEKNVFGFILLFICFSGTIISISVLYIFIMRVFYLLDIRNQIKELSDEIKIQLDENDKNEYKNAIGKIDIISDTIQNTIQMNRFEIVKFGFIEIEGITTHFIKNEELNEKQKFINHIYRILINSSVIITPNLNIIITNSFIDITTGICKSLLKKKELSSKTYNFIYILEKLTYQNEILDDTSSTYEYVIQKLSELGNTSINQKNHSVLKDIIHILGEMGKKLNTGTKRSYANLRIIFLFNHCLNKINQKEYKLKATSSNLNVILDELAGNIIFSLKKNVSGFHTEDVKNLLNSNSRKGITFTFDRCIEKINKNDITSPQTLELKKISESILKKLFKFLQTCCSKENQMINYFDIQEILYCIYKIGIKLIYEIETGNSKQSAFFQEILEHVFNPIKYLISCSMSNYKDMKFNFNNYLIIYTLIISLMIISNSGKKFETIIATWVTEIIEIYNLTYGDYKEYLKRYKSIDPTVYPLKSEKEIFDNIEMSLIAIYPYLRLIGALIYENMEDVTTINNLKDVLTEYETNNLILVVGQKGEFYPSSWSIPVFDKLSSEIKKRLNEAESNLFDFDFEEYEDYLFDIT